MSVKLSLVTNLQCDTPGCTMGLEYTAAIRDGEPARAARDFPGFPDFLRTPEGDFCWECAAQRRVTTEAEPPARGPITEAERCPT